MIFGSGVAGLSVLTHMHTLPTILLFIPHVDTSSLDEFAETLTHSPLRRNSVVCSFSTIACSLFSHAQDFPGLTTQFFLCGFENGAAPPFAHRLICGFDIVDVHAPVGKL